MALESNHKQVYSVRRGGRQYLVSAASLSSIKSNLGNFGIEYDTLRLTRHSATDFRLTVFRGVRGLSKFLSLKERKR